MTKITLKFSGDYYNNYTINPTVVLTLDESCKSYSFEYEEGHEDIAQMREDQDPLILPKRVLTAFTKSAVSKIFAKDEIPNESGLVILDGYRYNISITIDSETKEYCADDISIETYPLLRYLASWYSKL